MTDSPFADTTLAKPKPVRPRDEKGRLTKAVPERAPMSGVALPPSEPDEQSQSELQELHRLRTGEMRKPLSTRVQRLEYPKIPGFVCRWINDTPGRIKRARRGGYVNVEEDGKPVSEVVDQHSGLISYLMKIPQEFYDADFAAKQERLNEVDRQIYKGVHKQEAGDNRYVPKDGIKVGVRRGN